MYIKELKEIIENTVMYESVSENTEKSTRTSAVISVFMACVSAVLTALNIYNGYTFMTYTTTILIVGFAASALLIYFKRKVNMANIICSLMIALIFSIYAYTGENEGFAILWIMLVPLIAISWFGLKIGIATSLYFQVFLVILFYSPLRNHILTFYTDTFKVRFPILYFADMVASIILAVQKDYFLHKTEIQAYRDSLTGLGNRTLYNNEIKKLEQGNIPANFVLLSLDVNRLKYVNDNYGHEAGDEIIKNAGRLMREAFSERAVVCRVGGDEFQIIDYEEGVDKIRDRIKHFDELVKSWKGELVDFLSVSVGYAAKSDFPDKGFSDLSKMADKMMYENKSLFYRNSGFDRRR